MKSIALVKGDTVTLQYQVKEGGSPKDITGMTFKFAVKELPSDVAYKLGPVDGITDDALLGKFSIPLASGDTASVFSGRAEIAMYDGGGKKSTLTPPGGVEFRIMEDIIE